MNNGELVVVIPAHSEEVRLVFNPAEITAIIAAEGFSYCGPMPAPRPRRILRWLRVRRRQQGRRGKAS